MFKTLLGIAGMIGLALWGSADDFEYDSRIMSKKYNDIILADCKVIEVEEQEGGGERFNATLEIQSVYHGSKQWEGKTFNALSTGGGAFGAIITPPLIPGEIGIFGITQGSDGTLSPTNLRAPFGVYWPVRPGLDKRFSEAKALAEAIKNTVDAPSNARGDQLRELVFSETPEISAWSIHALADIEPNNSLTFFENIISAPNLSLAGSVALDEVLSELDPTSWGNSIRRQEFMKEWLKNPNSEYEVEIALRRISKAIQRNDLDYITAVDVLKTGANNKFLPIKCRFNAVNTIGHLGVVRREKSYDVFIDLIELLEITDSPDIQIDAAQTMKRVLKLDEKSKETIKNTRNKIQNKQVKAILDEILSKEDGLEEN